MRGLALFLFNALIAGTAQAATVAVTLDTPKPGKGEYFIAVYGSAETFPRGEPAHATRTRVTGEQQRIRIDVPAGRYAVAVYQDLNDNEQLDSNLVGVPSEPFGFSRNARGSMGPPEFDAAAFEVRGGQRQLAIRLKD